MNRSLIPETELITREKFLNALAETYLLQDAILNSTELSVISVNTEGIIMSFNPAAEYLLGYSHLELISKWTMLIIHDWAEIAEHARETSTLLGIPVEPGFESIVTKARISKTADRREWTYIRKDGSRFPVMLSLSGIWNDEGQLTGYLGIASDITEQKKIDERIRHSEAHLRALLQSIDDIAIEVNRERIYTNVWTKHDHLLFVEREKYIGKSIYEVLNGPFAQVLEIYETAIQKVFETKEPEYVEYTIPGSRVWRSGKISFIDQNSVLILIRDISDSKEVEQKIKDNEQKFRSLAENLPGVIYLCRNDATFSMLYLNEHVTKMTGYSPQEFMSGAINFVKLYHPEDAATIFLKVEEALASRQSFHVEYRLRHKKGHWIWIEEFGAGVYEHDKLVFLEGFLSDVTLRKNTEQEVIKISEEYNRVFNYSISLNAVAGFDGYFKKLNPAWEKILGFSLEELKSIPFITFIHPDDRQATEGTTSKLIQGIDINTFENRYRCKDGSYRWLLWTSSADLIHQLIYASAIDITERKEAEEKLLLSKSNLETAAEELQDQNKQLNSFAHVISHNLRSPVGNINALISLLDENSSMSDYQEIFKRLKLTAGSMSETLNDLMDTLKVKKVAASDLVPLRFSTILKKVMQDLAGEIIRSNANISSDFSACEDIVYNKPYLESIFLNLLSNTLKYRSTKRPLQVEFKTEQESSSRILLQVKDNGLGIDLTLYSNKLFGLRQTFHEHKDAKGVGLFLTKTQVEALGGKIWIESEVENGTTVFIQF